MRLWQAELAGAEPQPRSGPAAGQQGPLGQVDLIEGARQLTIALSVLPAVIHRDAAACNAYARQLLAAYPQYTNFGVGGAIITFTRGTRREFGRFEFGGEAV